MTITRVLQPIVQLLLAALLSATTLVLGAMPLLWLRRSTHGLVYVAWCLIAVLIGVQVGGAELWLPFLLNSILVFSFVLFETLWTDLLFVSALSIGLTGALGILGVSVWLEMHGQSLGSVFRTKAEEFSLQIAKLQPAIKVDIDSLLPQIPS
jgi:hypothetical protein